MTNSIATRTPTVALAAIFASLAIVLTACSAAPDPAVLAEEAAATVHEDIAAYVESFEGSRSATVRGIRCDGVGPESFVEQLESREAPSEDLTFAADCSYQKDAWKPLSDAGVENGYRFVYCTSQDLNVLQEFKSQVRDGETSFPKSMGTVSCINYSPTSLEAPPCEGEFPNCPQWLEHERHAQRSYEQRDTQVFPPR